MKALLMDVGNSRIKWGMHDDGQLRRTGHISRERIREQGLQVLTTRIPRRVDEVFVQETDTIRVIEGVRDDAIEVEE